jgi:hypothetical protein
MKYRLLPEQEFGINTAFYGGISGTFSKLIKSFPIYWGVVSEDEELSKLALMDNRCYDENLPLKIFLKGAGYSIKEDIPVGRIYVPESMEDDFENRLDFIIFTEISRNPDFFFGLKAEHLSANIRFYQGKSQRLIDVLNRKEVIRFNIKTKKENKIKLAA